MKIILRNLLVLVVFSFASSVVVAEMYEAVSNISVHDFPDRGAAQVGTIKRGEAVKIKQRMGAWLRVSDYENTAEGRKAQWVRDGGLKSFSEIEKERAAQAREEEQKRRAEESRLRAVEKMAREAWILKEYNSRARTTYEDSSETRQQIIEMILTKTRNSFKDPESVQFRGIYSPDGSMGVVCGEINAKNSYGGYTGYSRFMYVSGDIVVDSKDKNIDDEWLLYC